MIPLVERELNRIAQLRIRHLLPGQTLLPTALVNEAYMNLIGAGQMPWHDRNHFFAVASNKMHEIVIDYARGKSRVKNGRAVHKVPIDQELPMSQDPLIWCSRFTRRWMVWQLSMNVRRRWWSCVISASYIMLRWHSTRSNGKRFWTGLAPAMKGCAARLNP
jgi:hypothetical protein